MPHAPLTNPVVAHWTPDARWTRLLLAVLVLLVAGVPGRPIHAATITVDSLVDDGGGAATTLRE
ncbi:MAG: hypothetical protein O7A71_10765, partial [Chloroflexi bacterium]|nr:hypothetical protein [Chloroflexota bacterium]